LKKPSDPGKKRRDSAKISDRRIRLMRSLVLVAFLALAARVVDLQAFSGGHYSALAVGQVTNVEQVPALRGSIYDRNGTVLAISVHRWNVVADPYIIHDAPSEAAALSRVLDAPQATLESQLQENSGFVYVAKLVDQQIEDSIQNLDLPGINLVPTTEEIEPANPLAQAVVGSVAGSGNGNAGLEYEYNSLLSGQSGTLTDEESPSGVVLPDAPSNGGSGHNGNGIELTLDEPLQYVAESALGSALVSTHALSGTVVVMNVHTGAILAMANLVSNPATHQVTEAPQNLALTSVYEPGSVFKLVTFTAALQAGIITPTTELSVPPYMRIDGSVFHDAESHPTENLSATQILAQSSNLGTIEIAQKLHPKGLFDQMQKLGIGQPTGLDFPGESSGIVEPLSQWEPTDLASTAIGQDTSLTPMQVLDMMNTVASGGTFVPPRLVQAVVSPDGKLSDIAMAAEHRELSHGVTSELTGMLEQVVADGTAPDAAIPGYTVAGKTGTAQIPNPSKPGYLPGAYMATFTGFAPAQNPALSAVVVLNRPTPIFGGVVAAPVFSQVMSYALSRFEVPTDAGGTGVTGPVTTSQVPITESPASPPEGSDVTGSVSTTAAAATTRRSSGKGTDSTSTGEQPGTIAKTAPHNARGP
jgi:cell division protein FtsI (penicillin-binding protein 3)